MQPPLENYFDMLTKSRQEKFYNKHISELHTHLAGFYATLDPEDLHKLRVAYKKLNSLFYFLRKCSDDRKTLLKLKPLKEIFSHAGNIRTAGLNLELLRKYRIPVRALKKEQRDIQNENTIRFLLCETKYTALIKRAHSMHFKDIESRYILHVYRLQLEKLAHKFESDELEPELHDCRKKIKLLLYMLPAFDKRMLARLKLNKEYLDKLQETIGKWHDAFDTLQLLQEKEYTAEKFIRKPKREMSRVVRVIRSMTKDMRTKVFSEDV